MNISRLIFSGLAGIAWCCADSAAANIIVEPSKGIAIMKDGGSVAAGSIVTVKKGQIFYSQPLGDIDGATVENEVNFTFRDQNFTIGKDVNLRLSRIYGKGSQSISNGYALYCTPKQYNGNRRKMLGFSESLLVLNNIDLINELRRISTQSCLVDSDGDGKLDRAFISDTSNNKNVLAVEIPHTSVKKYDILRRSDENAAKIAFVGSSVGIVDKILGTTNKIIINLLIVEDSIARSFDNTTVIFNYKKLPETFNIFGSKITVLSYDQLTESAQIRIDRGFPGGEYGVTTTFGIR